MVITSLDGTVRPINLDSVGRFNFQVGGGWSQDPVAYPETVRPGNDPTQGIAAASLHFFLADHLGTNQMELSAQGYPVWRGQFAPYGGEMKNSVPIPPDAIDGSSNPYKFTAKERDSESGLDYFGARYYASSMGRWMSPDWADKPEAVPYSSLDDPQSLNLYGYLRNRRLSVVDPDGHDGWGDFTNFATAAINAWSSDNKLGFGGAEQTTAIGQLSATVGDGVAAFQGVQEAISGLAAAGIGAGGCAATGVGCVATPAAVAVGGLVAAHGTATGAVAAGNLLRSATNHLLRRKCREKSKKDKLLPT